MKYNKALFQQYLQGCEGIAQLVIDHAIDISGQPVICGRPVHSAHIDLRHPDFDIVILGLRSGPDDDARIDYQYRMIERSHGERGFCPDHVLKQGVGDDLFYSNITGDRIWFIKNMAVCGGDSGVSYAVRAMHEIFFEKGLCVTVQYWYYRNDPGHHATVPDGEFRFTGDYQAPRNSFLCSPTTSPGVHHARLSHDILHEEIAIHEKKTKGLMF